MTICVNDANAPVPGNARVCKRILSCLTLAAQVDGRTVTTIEGLGRADARHPLQAAFIAHDGLQCGCCTPGQICPAVAMLKQVADGVPSVFAGDLALARDEVRETMSGNLCRCGAYNGIVAAILEVASETAA